METKITVQIHNVPKHGDGELRFEIRKNGRAEGSDKHIDSAKDSVTRMGRAYTACITDIKEPVQFVLNLDSFNEKYEYVFEKIIDSQTHIIDVDCLKDAKQIKILNPHK